VEYFKPLQGLKKNRLPNEKVPLPTLLKSRFWRKFDKHATAWPNELE